MVYYRKYRPQIIADLDNEELRNTLYALLANRVSQNKKTSTDLPHAFLFTGQKGLGKTSAARIVAKIANCTLPKIKENPVELCSDECEACKSITSGTNMDVLEIDGASNRGIDEIRDLREKIGLL